MSCTNRLAREEIKMKKTNSWINKISRIFTKKKKYVNKQKFKPETNCETVDAERFRYFDWCDWIEGAYLVTAKWGWLKKKIIFLFCAKK